MGADKNSSPKRELGLCPKFTTKDSHAILPGSRSHNGPTNPRNKLQKQSQSGSTNQEAKDLAALRDTRRTVRGDRADSLRGTGGRSAGHGWTVRKRKSTLQWRTLNNGQSAPYPRTVREQPVPRGRSATSRQTIRQTPSGQKQLAKRIETKTLKNTRRT
jgi:hypothetical protein